MTFRPRSLVVFDRDADSEVFTVLHSEGTYTKVETYDGITMDVETGDLTVFTLPTAL